jgi:hypothetical protein
MVATYAVPINPRSSTSAVLRHCSQQHISAGTGFTLSEIEGELRDRPEGFADDDDEAALWCRVGMPYRSAAATQVRQIWGSTVLSLVHRNVHT